MSANQNTSPNSVRYTPMTNAVMGGSIAEGMQRRE